MTARYARQMLLPEMGAEGQALLAKARVLCVGAGGLGCPALLYLAAAGIGTIGIVDDDAVALSNLQRQILFVTEDQGANKAERAAQRLAALNPDIAIKAFPERLSAANALELLRGWDMVLDGTDNFAAKFLINDAAARLGLPVIYGALTGFEGQAGVFWARQDACYRCLHPQPPRHFVPNCAEAGVLGAVAGMIGALQGLEAVKLALGLDWCAAHGLEPLLGRLFLLDARTGQARTLRVPRRAACPVCSVAPETVRLPADAPPPVCSAAPPREESWAQAEARNAVVFLDVRERTEWEAGHKEGAHHAPLSALRGWSVLPPELAAWAAEGRPVAVYCQHGIRSREATRLLIALGLAQAFSVAGGFSAQEDTPPFHASAP